MTPSSDAAEERGPEAAPLRRRAPRWMWWVLIPSLALNLAVVGIVAGAGLSMRYAAAMHHGPGGIVHLVGFVDQLPAERRTPIRELISAQRALIGPLRREVRSARREAARALLAEPFDRAVFSDAQQRVLDAETRVRQAASGLMTEVASRLTAEERRKFLSWRSLRFGRGQAPGSQDAAPSDDDPPAEPAKKP